MHIKTIKLDNFKSYRGLNTVEGFDKGLNVIVGKNGSGKSNVFFGVQFVLSDDFEYLRTEEKLKIINESSGETTNSAYVEIVFDNSDNRFPINNNEVTIRRQITLKNDTYAVCGKIITKSELNNLLESAGFSKSNPYYIVKQGKISKLVASKDKERLELLLEIAGANVYDQRKTETYKLLEESNIKMKEIETLLDSYNDKINSLQVETDQFVQYQSLSQEKNCLEYIIHESIINECRKKLEEIEIEKESVIEKKKAMNEELDRIHDFNKKSSKELKDTIEKLELSKKLRLKIIDDIDKVIKEKTESELCIKDLKSQLIDETDFELKIKEELRLVSLKANFDSNKLSELDEKYQKIKEAEKEMIKKIEKIEEKKSQIYLRMKQKDNFKSVKERDNWLTTQINEYDSLLKKRKSQVITYQQDKESITRQVEDFEREIITYDMNIRNFKKSTESFNNEKISLSKKKEELEIKKKELWRNEASQKIVVESLKNELQKLEKSYEMLVPKAVLNGIENINKLVKEFKIEGVRGTLIDNIKCDEPFYIPVEVTAGSRLFNIIVDSDEIASKLLKLMNSKSLNGQVTFIPLNRVKTAIISKECLAKNEVIQIHNKIQYNEAVKSSITYVFGKCLLAKNSEIASKVSKEYEVDCVTMDGYYKSYKGTIFGGHYNSSKSRLRMRCQVVKCQKNLNVKQSELSETKSKISDIDKEIDLTNNEILQINIKIDQNNEAIERIKINSGNLNEQLISLKMNLQNKDSVLINIENDVEKFADLINGFEEEKRSSFSINIVEDSARIEEMNDLLIKLKSECELLTLERIKLQESVKNYEINLNDNLTKKCSIMKNKIDQSEVDNIKNEIHEKERILFLKNQSFSSFNKQLNNINMEIDGLKVNIDNLHSQLEIIKTRESNMLEGCDELNLVIDKLITNKNNIIVKKDDAVQKKIQLGLIKPEDISSYSGISNKNAWKKMDEVKEKLKSFGNLNENAMEQYLKFSSEKEDLNKRKKELDVSSQSIKNLIQVLDEQKQNAVLLTFKQVSLNFSETFKDIVPNGYAHLVMKREKKPVDASNNDFLNESDAAPLITTYDQRNTLESVTGVSIKVNFNAYPEESIEQTFDINQLSGGQKALLALTLIFAIQKCDPAPFFIFDEIDQALDPQYRQAVAQVIKRLSDKAQFIATTFRRDLVTYSQRTFGVKCINRSSHIQLISNDLALDFIDRD